MPMAYQISPASTRERRPFVWLERLLLLAFLFCVLVGIGALVVWWQLRSDEPATIGADPLGSVRTEQISPALALRQLAGDLADGLAYQTTQAGELETARAILTYDADLTAAGRAVRLAQLARRYQELDQPLAAAQVHRLVTPSSNPGYDAATSGASPIVGPNSRRSRRRRTTCRSTGRGSPGPNHRRQDPGFAPRTTQPGLHGAARPGAPIGRCLRSPSRSRIWRAIPS